MVNKRRKTKSFDSEFMLDEDMIDPDIDSLDDIEERDPVYETLSYGSRRKKSMTHDDF